MDATKHVLVEKPTLVATAALYRVRERPILKVGAFALTIEAAQPTAA
jgi:hypothetical protein